MRSRRISVVAAVLPVVLALLASACSSSGTASGAEPTPAATTPPGATAPTGSGPTPQQAVSALLPGMPPYPSPTDVYAADRALSPAVTGAKPLVYVPNSKDNTVTVIDQQTMQVLELAPGEGQAVEREHRLLGDLQRPPAQRRALGPHRLGDRVKARRSPGSRWRSRRTHAPSAPAGAVGTPGRWW